MHSLGTLLRFIWRSGKRASVFVLGVALLTVGLIMFVTPGPGIVLVVAGLAVLATEFAWAEHLLDKAKKQAARAGQSAQRVPGVARATTVVGRLVPRRWRRTSVTPVTVAETTLTGTTVAGVAAGGVAAGGGVTGAGAAVTEIDNADVVGRAGGEAPADASIHDAS